MELAQERLVLVNLYFILSMLFYEMVLWLSMELAYITLLYFWMRWSAGILVTIPARQVYDAKAESSYIYINKLKSKPNTA